MSSIEAGRRGVRGNRFGELTLSSLQSGTEEHCPCLPRDHACRFVVHDEDTIFSKQLDMEVTGLGVRVLRTPVFGDRCYDWEDGLGPKQRYAHGCRARKIIAFLRAWRLGGGVLSPHKKGTDHRNADRRRLC